MNSPFILSTWARDHIHSISICIHLQPVISGNASDHSLSGQTPIMHIAPPLDSLLHHNLARCRHGHMVRLRNAYVRRLQHARGGRCPSLSHTLLFREGGVSQSSRQHFTPGRCFPLQRGPAGTVSNNYSNSWAQHSLLEIRRWTKISCLWTEITATKEKSISSSYGSSSSKIRLEHLIRSHP